MNNNSIAQELESFVPVYDAIPDEWNDARDFLVEHLKKISNAVNVREIGWYLDEELLSGKALFPGAPVAANPTTLQNRQIFRFTIDSGALVIGANPAIVTTITFDNNFLLFDCWVAATNTGTLTAQIITGNDVQLTSVAGVVNVTITSPAVFTNSTLIIEYTQEGS